MIFFGFVVFGLVSVGSFPFFNDHFSHCFIWLCFLKTPVEGFLNHFTKSFITMLFSLVEGFLNHFTERFLTMRFFIFFLFHGFGLCFMAQW